MKKSLYIGLLFSILAVPGWSAGCSEMAAFNSKVEQYMETASLSDSQIKELNSLTKACQQSHDQGQPVKDIMSCKKVINMVDVY